MKQRILFLTLIILLLGPDIFEFNHDLFNFSIKILSKISLFFLLFTGFQFLLKSKRKTLFIISVVYLFSTLAEIPSLITIKQFLSLENVKAFYYTTPTEFFDFIKNFKILLILPLFVISTFFLLFKTIRIEENNNKKRLLSIFILTFLILVGVIFFRMKESGQYLSGKNLLKYSFKQYILKEHPFNVYYRIYELIYFKHKTDGLKLQRKKFNFYTEKKDVEKASPDVVVFIIGEGMRFKNWTLNGYKRNTSPNLNKIENLVSFSNHFSNANSTAASIPLILTRATPDNPYLAFKEKTIISLFKEFGYDTSWISNQNILFLENEKESDKIYKLYENKKSTDLDVLPALDNVLKNNHGKKFILINLVGNHSGKLPNVFDKFKPYEANLSDGINAKEALINQYDNKILLQDYVLSEIIKKLDKLSKNSIMIFSADHGVNLFDSKSNNLFGYGSSNPTRFELNTPMFFWYSKNYEAAFPNEVKNMKKNKNEKTVNNDLFYTLSDLSNITFKGFQEDKSISNVNFLPSKNIHVAVGGNSKIYNY